MVSVVAKLPSRAGVKAPRRNNRPDEFCAFSRCPCLYKPGPYAWMYAQLI